MHLTSLKTLIFATECGPEEVWIGITDIAGQDMPDSSFLSPAEQAAYQRLRVATRRTEFLAGRFTAKATIRAAIPARASCSGPTISIVNGVWGFPLLHTPGLERGTISISHTARRSAALFFHDNTHPMAVDIEEIGTDTAAALDRFIPPAESRQCAAELTDHVAIVHLLWSAREALGKALRVGFALPDHCYAIASCSACGDGMFLVSYEHFPQLHALAWLDETSCITVAIPSGWHITTMTTRPIP